MKVKQFKDKYDKEYVALLLEINKRIAKDFTKADLLKITSWIKAMSLPTDNISWKKNRNLYVISLLDNLINDRFEAPFNKFAHDSFELPVLTTAMVKSKLSRKFYEEMKQAQPDEDIQNFLNVYFYVEEQSSPNTAASTPSHTKVKKMTPVPKTQFNESDILLNKSYFGFQKKLGNERAFIENRGPQCEKLEQYKLESLIQMLQKETALKSEVIAQQSKEIDDLHKRICILDNKVKKLFK